MNRTYTKRNHKIKPSVYTKLQWDEAFAGFDDIESCDEDSFVAEIKSCGEDQYGYHRSDIERFDYGTPDKIKEECDEFIDAIDQESPVMALTELSDMLGAINGYLDRNHPSISIEDLLVMSQATARAFKKGER